MTGFVVGLNDFRVSRERRQFAYMYTNKSHCNSIYSLWFCVPYKWNSKSDTDVWHRNWKQVQVKKKKVFSLLKQNIPLFGEV